MPFTPARSAPLRLLLAIDTCGPTGSVALARLAGASLAILGQRELEGRSYSATLVSAVADLLAAAAIELRQLDAIVAVHGPGSFTGVRVGLSAVKGLAEAAQIPVLALSRLEVLAAKAELASAAIDAHRQEVFLRLGAPHCCELLAGASELAALDPLPQQVAVCEQAAAELLTASWPGVALIRTAAPTAADALTLAAKHFDESKFVDLALLDGHYLRRSDAEIFGAETQAARQPSAEKLA